MALDVVLKGAYEDIETSEPVVNEESYGDFGNSESVVHGKSFGDIDVSKTVVNTGHINTLVPEIISYISETFYQIS